MNFKIGRTYYKKKLYKSIFCLFLIALVVFSVISFFISSVLKKNIIESQNNTSKNSAGQFSEYFCQSCSLLFAVSKMKGIPDVILNDENKNLKFTTLVQNLTAYQASCKYIKSITISNGDITLYTTLDQKYLNSYSTLIGTYNGCEVYVNSDVESSDLLFCVNIPNVKFYNLKILVNSNYLSEVILNTNQYLVNDRGRILISGNRTYDDELADKYRDTNLFNINKVSSGYGKFYVGTAELNSGDFYIMTIVHKSDYYLQFVEYLGVLFMLAVILMSVLLSIIIHSFRATYKPIFDIVQTFKYHFPLEDSDVDELAYINRCIANTLGCKVSSDEASQAISKMQIAQAKAVYSQIAPHFIFNVLDNLKWRSISLLGYKNEIANSIILLNKIIYQHMQQNNMFTSIKNEVEITGQYIALLNIKFEKRLNIVFNIDNNMQNKSIIKLTFQPFVENSVLHSYQSDNENFYLHIDLMPCNEGIKIIIKDNGTGIDSDTLNEIKESLKNDDLPTTHIGMKNVHLRYRLLYGKNYGITDIVSSESGTEISLIIPDIDATDIE